MCICGFVCGPPIDSGTPERIWTIDGSFDSAPRQECLWRGFVVLRNRIFDLAAHFFK